MTKTKHSLLMSAIALLLCCSMLIGTTFAWFTDSVTSSNNKIQSGTLKVDLLLYKDGTYTSIKEDNDPIFNYDKWEPGYTDIKLLQVKNEGTLALKWVAQFVAKTELSILADVIDVYVLPSETALSMPANRSLDGYTSVGTVRDFVNTIEQTTNGTLTAGDTAYLGIALKMQEDANNDYQGLDLGGAFDIRIFATQLTAEEDSFDENYDVDAFYPVATVNGVQYETFADALANANGATIVLEKDLKLTEKLVINNGESVVIDLNGKTISSESSVPATFVEAILVNGNLTMKNGTVSGAFTGANMGWNGGYGVFDVTAGGVLNLTDVTVNSSGTDMNFGVHLNNWGEVTLNADKCVFNSTYCGVRVFNSGYDMNNITIKNSKLTGATRAFWVHNYIGDLNANDHSNDDINARLNFDIYNNNNTFEITGTAFSPIRYGFGNSVYFDETGKQLAVANTSDALVEALESGKDVVLANDVKIEPANMSNAYGTTGINVKNGQTIDGNGNVLDIKGAGGTWDSGISTTGGIIKNITVTGSFRGIFINHNSTYSEKVVLENVIIDGTVYTISCDQGTNQGLEATNSTFNGWTSYAATLGNAKFVDCSFGEGSGYSFCRPYAPTEFVGCEFEAGFTVDPVAEVTFENCTLDGVAITSSNVSDLVTDITNVTVK